MNKNLWKSISILNDKLKLTIFLRLCVFLLDSFLLYYIFFIWFLPNTWTGHGFQFLWNWNCVFLLLVFILLAIVYGCVCLCVFVCILVPIWTYYIYTMNYLRTKHDPLHLALLVQDWNSNISMRMKIFLLCTMYLYMQTYTYICWIHFQKWINKMRAKKKNVQTYRFKSLKIENKSILTKQKNKIQKYLFLFYINLFNLFWSISSNHIRIQT